ncbi:hypothetical protein [Pectobacterium wasabiae]|uniref:Uncharacterized protein n=1 Tax=Pectobacterium wasabiae TaxID=55208 RepID=A0AAW3EDE1_9GAMM|nr:hypothetical protein [Pectobacterium wasabiae]AOR63382.1 hypothetical protein A7983_08935 [Pectobacterium wasabiae CFBP 3304]EJS96059.1 Hypothetical protein Y17_0691 [Pectobacterium wasabiae CFBP 3304]KFX04119.1 hypothetical protein JV38_16510 [Pectobacterium wasabiae]KGA27253.1 hypothetical protein KU73_16500 [Pectobacterium wasabiae]
MNNDAKINFNFDCSQLVSFKFSDVDRNQLKGLTLIENMGFKVLIDHNIKEVKKEYFRSSDDEFFIEFEDKEFVGDIEDWSDFDNPPERIVDFANNILKLKELNGLRSVSIFISIFSELGKTSNCIIDISPEELMKTLYFMSRSNFDVWVDNLTMHLID